MAGERSRRGDAVKSGEPRFPFCEAKTPPILRIHHNSEMFYLLAYAITNKNSKTTIKKVLLHFSKSGIKGSPQKKKIE